MANLVVTIIAIALVAAMTLMGVYYGGSAYLTSQLAAHAAAVIDQGQQLNGDWQDYIGDHLDTPPADASILVSSNYVAQWPSWPAEPGVAPAPYIVVSVGSNYYAIADMGASTSAGSIANDGNATACNRIVTTALGSNTGLTTSSATNYTAMVAGGANLGIPEFGCGLPQDSSDAAPLPYGGVTPTLPPVGGLGAGHYIAYYQLS